MYEPKIQLRPIRIPDIRDYSMSLSNLLKGFSGLNPISSFYGINFKINENESARFLRLNKDSDNIENKIIYTNLQTGIPIELISSDSSGKSSCIIRLAEGLIQGYSLLDKDKYGNFIQKKDFDFKINDFPLFSFRNSNPITPLLDSLSELSNLNNAHIQKFSEISRIKL